MSETIESEKKSENEGFVLKKPKDYPGIVYLISAIWGIISFIFSIYPFIKLENTYFLILLLSIKNQHASISKLSMRLNNSVLLFTEHFE